MIGRLETLDHIIHRLNRALGSELQRCCLATIACFTSIVEQRLAVAR